MSRDNEIPDNIRYKMGEQITWVVIIINIALAIIKIFIGVIGKSKGMIADGIHTISDVGSSLGIIIGFFISKKPEDSKHQYGHEKAESISEFMLSLFLIATGVKIGYSAIQSIFLKGIETPSIITLWVALVSIVIKEIQFRMTINVGKKINSSALIADAWHHRSDALSSIAVLLGILGARAGYPIFDALAGIAVSLIVIKVGIELFITGYNELMDSSIAEEKLFDLADKIMDNTKVTNINEIRTRVHGSKAFIDMKICVPNNISVEEGHEISEEVERIAYEEIDNLKDIIVHVNPCDKGNKECVNCKSKTSRFLKERK